ncbi:MAG: HAD-IA family hydrolase [Clostridia bacterium]|nr:HAD-IA family hydrolase [Clostridia bacterium]
MKAVIFDLFETLVTEWGHEKLTKRQISEMLGLPEQAFSDAMEALDVPQYRGRITYADSLRQIGRTLGCELPETLIAQVIEKRRQTKAACFDLLHPQILPMLEALRGAGYRLAILSNCSDEEVDAVRGHALARAVDAVLLSHEVGLCKPEPEFYRLAAETLGTACGDCVYIGDGGSRELYGAAEVGMRAGRAVWYLRAMPFPIREQPPFVCLESPMDVIDFAL